MRRRQALTPFEPFVGFNPYRQGAGPRPAFVAALEAGDGYLCVEFQIGLGQIVVFAAKRDEFPARYSKLDENVATHVQTLVAQARQYGATLEAIQLLGALTPLTKKEEAVMATAKLSRNEANKAELTEAAKKASVKPPTKAAAKAEPAKAKGNTAALEKARAARGASTAEFDKKKVKVIAKANPYREGTKAHATFELFKGKATVGDVKAAATADHDLGYLRYAARDGHISVT